MKKRKFIVIGAIVIITISFMGFFTSAYAHNINSKKINNNSAQNLDQSSEEIPSEIMIKIPEAEEIEAHTFISD